MDIDTFAEPDFNFDEATNSDDEFDLLNVTPHENIPKRKYVMFALHDIDMQVVDGDSILHFDEQHSNDEGDHLPFEVNGKEVELSSESLHPLISEIVPNQVNLPLVFEVNILDLPLVLNVVPNDGCPNLVFPKIAQCEDIISCASSNLSHNLPTVDNGIVDSNAISQKLAKSKRKKLVAPSNIPKRVTKVEGLVDTPTTLSTKSRG